VQKLERNGAQRERRRGEDDQGHRRAGDVADR
jgi:hypothetical protein